MEKYRGQLYNVKVDRYNKKNKVYSNDILTFDIEVTSAWLTKDKQVIKYHEGESNEFWNSLVPLSLCYIWQFSFNDKVYYGRELSEFECVLQNLPSNVNFIIWVHNLSYEFHFLTNFLKWKKVFARSPHKPIKAISEKYPNIEFRCSYVLTRLSLRTWGQELGTYKDSPIDYEQLRTPYTKLTDEELHYCEQDCLVVYEGIKKYREKYKFVKDIPLTQTGTVRREVKHLLVSDRDYVKFIKGLIPKSAQQYTMLMDLFAGGYTHANKKYSGKVVKGLIEHYDFASSYPTVMIAEKYPMGRWVNVTDIENFPNIKKFDNWAYIFKVRFYNIRCETDNTYIQSSKCTGKNIYKDNGRVLMADYITITINEQDYLTIRETYTWKRMKVIEMYKAKKDYLPRIFVDYILDLYKNKTELKGVEGKEELYTQSKQYINSMYGMCVTAILQSEVQYEDDTWSILPMTEDDINDKLHDLKVQYKRKKYFLSYSWGVWVTSYARRNLWKCIESVDSKVLYCDTDSIFVLDKQDFKWYNEEVTEKLRAACKYQGLDFEKTRPKTIKGKQKPLGVFDKEDDCIEFITLGAKRYVERRASDNELHLTVSGINKEAVQLLKNKIKNFKNGFNFDKDAPCVHKQLSTYNNNQPVVTYPDGYVSHYRCGVNLRRTGYLLTIADDYQELIDSFNKYLDNMSDTAYNKIRKVFR